MDQSPSSNMIRSVIVFVVFIGNGFIGRTVFVTSATLPPSGPQSSSKRGGGISKDNRNDVPIIPDNISPEKRRKESKRSQNRRRQSSMNRSGMKPRDRNSSGDDLDWKKGSDDLPSLFFFGANKDNNTDERIIYERWFRNRRPRKDTENLSNSESESDEETFVFGPSFKSLRQWTYEKTGFYIPKINLHFEPVTTLKLRKSWHNVIPGAIIRVGADFETQTMMGTGVWRLRGCLEDKLIGGRFSIKGKKSRSGGALVEYSKSWLFPGAGKYSFGVHF